ncbi:uncharacterized protein LOC133532449 [Cydia pomonella]|uniref:uncharacterized protein LOC133532449 n=1 Tax=Cydia pomonella TaxID=82600 RepID=UPI002ADD55C9|nr:uncharacterized protein LOC133532449 [Cydia pomonella]
MSELTVHSVCTKGPIYPTLLYFQNGCPTKDFETNCAVLQDKNKSRTIVMETSELVYAGKEEKEETGTMLILARDRITGIVRLIEVGSADLKPLTKTDLDHLQHQNEAKASSKMRFKKTNTHNISNAVQMDTEQIIDNNVLENAVACNDSIGELNIPPVDREITKDELDSLQQQQQLSRSEFSEFKKKQSKETEVVKQQNLTENYTEEFYIPPINRRATKVEDVYHLEKILSKDEYDKIFQELEENNYVTDLHPYIQSYMKGRHLSPQLTVLAAYASYLIKYLHVSWIQITAAKYKICAYSKTLNDIIMNKFTKLTVYKKSPNDVHLRRIKPRKIQLKAICHIMVFMLILNNYKFYLEPLCTAVGKQNISVKRLVHFTGASIVRRKVGRLVRLRLPLVRNTNYTTVCKDTDTLEQLKEEKRLVVLLDQREQIETVTANDMVNNVQSKNDNPDLDSLYLPSINRDAAQVQNVYLVEKILSRDEFEQIYCELVETNYTADLHPYILSFIENKTLSLQLTVLALYTSELLKLVQLDNKEIMKKDFILCHYSITLNNIIMEHFTKHCTNKHIKQNKILCHIIVFTLILCNFSFKLMPFFKVLNVSSGRMMKMIALTGASIIIEDSEMTVQLKLPLVPKPGVTRSGLRLRKPGVRLRKPGVRQRKPGVRQRKPGVRQRKPGIRQRKPGVRLRKPKVDKKFVLRENEDEIDPDEFYVPFLNREATNLEDVYVIKEILSEDEYVNIFFELSEHNYMDDLHPYIKQFVETRTLSLEFTVLAVYASVLIKFLNTNINEIRKANYKICHHSKILNEILIKRFTERFKYSYRCEKQRPQAMRNKAVCHIIVCTLILNNFQFKIDHFDHAIRRKKRNGDPIPKLVRYVAATIETGDSGTMVKLKLPLVPKTRAARLRIYAIKHKMDLKKKEASKEETVKIDPDDFYLPSINREATEVEDVYPVEEILSKDEYEAIYYELQQHNYKDNLHPYIQSFIENKTLSLQLTVLAAYANELLKEVNTKNGSYRITRLSDKLNNIFKKRFISETRMVKNKLYDIKERMLCHIIVCLLILNNFRFKLEDFCNTIKNTYVTKHVEMAVSLVGAVIVNGDEGLLVELKLPLVPKQDIIDITSKYRNKKSENKKKEKSENKKKEKSENKKKEKSENKKKKNKSADDETEVIDPDDFYVPPINREATELENVYLIDKLFSKSKYKKIYCELEKSNYSENLHPYIQSIIKNKLLSKQFTVLAVYASELIKFIHVKSELRGKDFKICHFSETLNDLLLKEFTEFREYKSAKRRIRSKDMTDKIICHVIVCCLILNNFQFELKPLYDALKPKKCIRTLIEFVGLVGASIVDGNIVQLKLPLVPKPPFTRRKPSTAIINSYLSKPRENR